LSRLLVPRRMPPRRSGSGTRLASTQRGGDPSVPRTEKPRKRRLRFCGDCGYELSPDNDGTCPMCPRFEQLRLDLAVARPPDSAVTRAAVRDAGMPPAPGDWPPTAAEYRALLAKRRKRHASGDQPPGTVIRTPRLTRIRVPPLPDSPSAPGHEVVEREAQRKLRRP
jgi:hypothetical protein